MFPFEDRFTRQRQLAEVGVAGQERIAQLRVTTTLDEAGVVATEYLQRAGVTTLRSSSGAPTPPFPHSGFFHHGAARDFGAGSHRALSAIRRCLGLQPDLNSAPGRD